MFCWVSAFRRTHVPHSVLKNELQPITALQQPKAANHGLATTHLSTSNILRAEKWVRHVLSPLRRSCEVQGIFHAVSELRSCVNRGGPGLSFHPPPPLPLCEQQPVRAEVILSCKWSTGLDCISRFWLADPSALNRLTLCEGFTWKYKTEPPPPPPLPSPSLHTDSFCKIM